MTPTHAAENSDGMGGKYASIVSRFMAQDERLRALEATVGPMASDHVRIMDALFNGDDGEHGLLAVVSNFITRQEMRDIAAKEVLVLSEKAKLERIAGRDAAWRWFRWIIVTLLTAGALLLGWKNWLETNRQIQQHQLHWPQIGPPSPQGKVYSAHVRVTEHATKE